MLRTRLWMGSVLIALTIGMLTFDQGFAPWHPFQFAFQTLLALAACWEVVRLFGPERPVHTLLLFVGSTLLTIANFVIPSLWGPDAVWLPLFGGFVGLQMATFLAEMAVFRDPGQSVERMARTCWGVGYLALLPSFLAQLPWLYPPGSRLGTIALALAIFVPKACDVGAYFAGRLFGRHRMTPVLSPKKTWEGAVGGLILASGVAMLIDRITDAHPLGGCWGWEIGFGIVLGATGMLGDLAESLIKRDCQKKDASETVPGFGGVLDVVDAVVFAAPVAWLGCWLSRWWHSL
ncbi:MAG: phosphatidate cytidylyltransferase [Gemmataceae bacterium]